MCKSESLIEIAMYLKTGKKKKSTRKGVKKPGALSPNNHNFQNYNNTTIMI